MVWAVYQYNGELIGHVDAPDSSTALREARRRWAFVAYVQQVSAETAAKGNATRTRNSGGEPLPPKRSKSGKLYYPQPNPEKRGWDDIKVRLTDEEGEIFREDAKAHGGVVAYVRYLWAQDRIRRGLQPVPPRRSSQDRPSE